MTICPEKLVAGAMSKTKHGESNATFKSSELGPAAWPADGEEGRTERKSVFSECLLGSVQSVSHILQQPAGDDPPPEKYAVE